MKERLIYPDICKAIAIFIVTCSHSAQEISGLTWTNFLGGVGSWGFNLEMVTYR